MTNQKPLLLLSNDDGVTAKGINELIKILRPMANLVVVAPDGPRSGASGAITSERPLRYSLVKQEPGLTIYKCSGTPVDCVKLALHELVPHKPDMVIGGINHGDNSSVNVHYSGTMGVVIEGCLKGIPSVGFSLCNHLPDADFEPSFPYVKRVVAEVLEHGLPFGICVNEFVKAEHPRGGNYFWLTGEYHNMEPGVEGTDHWALDNGYVAITPTRTDVTAYSFMEQLAQWNLEV